MFSHFPSPALQLLLIAGFHPTTIYLVLKDAVVVWKTISILLSYKYLLTLPLTEIISDFGIWCLHLSNFSLSCSYDSHLASYICFPFWQVWVQTILHKDFSLILVQPNVCFCSICCPKQLSLVSFFLDSCRQLISNLSSLPRSSLSLFFTLLMMQTSWFENLPCKKY